MEVRRERCNSSGRLIVLLHPPSCGDSPKGKRRLRVGGKADRFRLKPVANLSEIELDKENG